MQICFYYPTLQNDQNKAIFGSMYSSFFKQLELQGVHVILATYLHEIKGDILVVSIGGGGEPAAAKAMHLFKGPVILHTHNAYLYFYKSFLKRWSSKVLFSYCTDFATLNFTSYNSVGIPYYHFPFGSDKDIFYPMNLEKQYDITFLGNASSGYGRDRYIEKLVDYTQKKQIKVFLAGSGWDKYGFPYRIVEHGEQTNLIYNQSKICINIHNDRQFAGLDKEMDANNRLFDLAMAGCCQISNGEQMISKYFNQNEVNAADNPEEWIQKIDYYLNNQSEREIIAHNAREKALNFHTWEKRATDFIQYINDNYPKYIDRKQKINWLTSLSRYLDQYLIPPYLYKEIRIMRFILKKLNLYTQK
jgi:glycosyltransferase involved in cell wall biosynthesis